MMTCVDRHNQTKGDDKDGVWIPDPPRSIVGAAVLVVLSTRARTFPVTMERGQPEPLPGDPFDRGMEGQIWGFSCRLERR